MADLSGRAALVTGAASGIGLATAHALAQAGAAVTLADMDVERGQAEAAHIPGARFAAVDLTVAGSGRRSVAEGFPNPGPHYIVFNNSSSAQIPLIQRLP